MHVAHEIFTERDEEQDAQHAAKQRRDKHLDERSAHLGIFSLQDVDGGQREDGTCHHGSRAGTDALNDVVLA